MSDYEDTPISIAPGIYKETTGHAARGRYVDGNNVRFWKGFPERIGGWAALVDSTDKGKFGGASGLFDGTGDWITTPDHADFALGSGDFTIDLWFKCTAAGGAVSRLCGQCDAAASAASLSFRMQRTTGNVILATVSDGATLTSVTGTTQFTDVLNTGWHHCAFVRTGNILRLFLDGAQEGGDISFSATVVDSTDVLAVGTIGAVTSTPWTGSIDEFRLSVGIARWTANFSPPTAAYSAANGNDSYTKILLHFDGADTSTTFNDSNAGGSAHTWTAAGNAQIDSHDPARGALAFKTLANVQYVGHGSASKLMLMTGATRFDITPASEFTAGSVHSSSTFGWGDGSWGSSVWGGSETLYTVTNHALTWTLGTWGEDLIACPRGQSIFAWDASVGTGTPAARIAGSPPVAAGIFISDVDRTLVAYGAHDGYRSTVTITIASPGVVTWTNHGHSNGDFGTFTTTGALPTGLAIATRYYIVNATTNTFQLSATLGGAAINTSGSQSGVHTFTTGDADPLNIRWSNSEDYSTWRPAATNTAGSIRCEVGNEIVGRVSARGGQLICTDQATYYFRYIGGTFVYSLNKISDGPSMIGPHAGVQDESGNSFWMGPKSFYVYDGTVSTLPCDVHDYVFRNINVSQRFKVYCGTIRQFNEVIWFYARIGSTEIDSCVAYNTVERTWWTGDLARTSWVDRSVVIDYPIGFSGDGMIYAQETGTNGDGTAIDYSLETSDLGLANGMYLRGRKLIVDYDRITGSHDVEIDVRGYPERTATTIGPYAITSSTSQLSIRARGREVRFRVSGSDDFRIGRWQVRSRVDGAKE